MTSSDTQAIATLQTHTAPSQRQGNDVTNEEFPPNLPGRPQLKNQPLNNECSSKLLPLLPHTLPTAESGVTSPRHQTNAPPVRGSIPKSLLPHQTAPSCTTSPNQQKVLPKIPATLQKQWAPNVRSPLQKQGVPNERPPTRQGGTTIRIAQVILGDEKPHTTTPLATGEPTNARAKANAQVRLRGGTDTDTSPEAFNDLMERHDQLAARKDWVGANKTMSDFKTLVDQRIRSVKLRAGSGTSGATPPVNPVPTPLGVEDETERAYAADTLWATLQRERLVWTAPSTHRPPKPFTGPSYTPPPTPTSWWKTDGSFRL